MTRKDYILIATVISSVGLLESDLSTLCDKFALALEVDNPAFNKGMFVKACRGLQTRKGRKA